MCFYLWTLSCSSVSLLASTMGWLLCFVLLFFFSESPAVGCVQYSFMDLAPHTRIRYHAVLPVLHHQETSSQHCCVMHVSVMHISEHCLKLTILSVPQIDIPKRDWHIRTHVHCENRSLIQSLVLTIMWCLLLILEGFPSIPCWRCSDNQGCTVMCWP